MQHSKVQVLEVETDAVTKKKNTQQRWDSCQITDLFCQWDVSSTRRSNESRGALRQEAFPLSLFYSLTKNELFKGGEKKSSVRSLYGWNQVKWQQKAASFGSPQTFTLKVVWGCGWCDPAGVFAPLVYFLSVFKWLSTVETLHARVSLAWVGKKKGWMSRKLNDTLWNSVWEDGWSSSV